jgi:flavin reductase (DIM6/NTAB) family NADH-FMN oxidoreductase RutF
LQHLQPWSAHRRNTLGINSLYVVAKKNPTIMNVIAKENRSVTFFTPRTFFALFFLSFSCY